MEVKKEEIINAYSSQDYQISLNLITSLSSEAQATNEMKILKASCLINLEDQIEEAHKILDEIITEDPENSFAYYGKGLAYLKEQKLVESIENFTKAAELDKTGMISKAQVMKLQTEKMLKKQRKSRRISFKKKPESAKKSAICEICNKTFAQQYSLNRHKLLHSADRPIKCTLCTCSFIQKSDLTKHMTTTHNKGKGKKNGEEKIKKKNQVKFEENCDEKVENDDEEGKNSQNSEVKIQNDDQKVQKSEQKSQNVEEKFQNIQNDKKVGKFQNDDQNIQKSSRKVQKSEKKSQNDDQEIQKSNEKIEKPSENFQNGTKKTQKSDESFQNSQNSAKKTQKPDKKAQTSDEIFQSSQENPQNSAKNAQKINKKAQKTTEKVKKTPKRFQFKLPKSKTVQCDICNKEFRYKKLMKLHRITHSTRQKMNCDFCEKIFVTKPSLNAHVMSHINRKRKEDILRGLKRRSDGSIVGMEGNSSEIENSNIKIKSAEIALKEAQNGSESNDIEEMINSSKIMKTPGSNEGKIEASISSQSTETSTSGQSDLEIQNSSIQTSNELFIPLTAAINIPNSNHSNSQQSAEPKTPKPSKSLSSKLLNPASAKVIQEVKRIKLEPQQNQHIPVFLPPTPSPSPSPQPQQTSFVSESAAESSSKGENAPEWNFFFKSLMHDLGKMDDKQKRKFKLKTFSLIDEILE